MATCWLYIIWDKWTQELKLDYLKSFKGPLIDDEPEAHLNALIRFRELLGDFSKVDFADEEQIGALNAWAQLGYSGIMPELSPILSESVVNWHEYLSIQLSRLTFFASLLNFPVLLMEKEVPAEFEKLEKLKDDEEARIAEIERITKENADAVESATKASEGQIHAVCKEPLNCTEEEEVEISNLKADLDNELVYFNSTLEGHLAMLTPEGLDNAITDMSAFLAEFYALKKKLKEELYVNVTKSAEDADTTASESPEESSESPGESSESPEGDADTKTTTALPSPVVPKEAGQPDNSSAQIASFSLLSIAFAVASLI